MAAKILKSSRKARMRKNYKLLSNDEIKIIRTHTKIDFSNICNQTNVQCKKALKLLDKYLSGLKIFDRSILQEKFDAKQTSAFIDKQAEVGMILIASIKIAKLYLMQDANEQKSKVIASQQIYLLSNISFFVTLLYRGFKQIHGYFPIVSNQKAYKTVLEQYRQAITRYYQIIKLHIAFAENNDEMFSLIIESFSRNRGILDKYTETGEYELETITSMLQEIYDCPKAQANFPVVYDIQRKVRIKNRSKPVIFKLQLAYPDLSILHKKPLKRKNQLENNDEATVAQDGIEYQRESDGERQLPQPVKRRRLDEAHREEIRKKEEENKKVKEELASVMNQLILSQMAEKTLTKQVQELERKTLKPTSTSFTLSASTVLLSTAMRIFTVLAQQQCFIPGLNFSLGENNSLRTLFVENGFDSGIGYLDKASVLSNVLPEIPRKTKLGKQEMKLPPVQDLSGQQFSSSSHGNGYQSMRRP